MTDDTLQKIKELERSRVEAEREKKRRRRKKRVPALLCAIILCAGIFALYSAGAFDGLFHASALADEEGIPELSTEAPVEVISVVMENGVYTTVTLASGVTTTVSDYESEYVQFGIGEALVMPEAVIDGAGQDVTGVIDAPDYSPLPSFIPTPTYIDPSLPEEAEISDADDAFELEAEGEGQYAAVWVNDVVICVLNGADDYEWVMERLYNSCGTAENAKVSHRGTVENVKLYLQESAPSRVVTKEECFMLLLDEVTLKWTEQQSETERVEPSVIYMDDDTLLRGQTKVSQEGERGSVKNTYAVSYVGGEETGRELIAQSVTQEATPEIILRGTKVVATPKPTATQKPSSSTTPAPASGTSGYWPGTTIGKGIDYPNIDTSKSRPDPYQGIPGPDSGSLSFRYPTDKTRISSYFGWRYGRMHYGIDIFDDRNSPVYASESGTVTSYTGTHTGYGLIVEISHGNGFTTRYAHCETILVSEGQTVQKGEVIALMGDSGTTSSDPHCHFEIRADGVPYNAQFYLN